MKANLTSLLLLITSSVAFGQTTRPSSYMTIPLRGEIGVAVTAEGVRAALAEARHAKAEYVIFLVESPGGSIAEMQRICDAVTGAVDLKRVAFVKQALSAAAVISLTCPVIVMYPDSQIGGAVPMELRPSGLGEVREKFRSIYAAMCRSAAVSGKHSPLLADAMTSADSEVYISSQSGRPVLAAKALDDSYRSLKARGRILTLTADEAVECGLAAGKGMTLGDVRRTLGVGSWEVASNEGERLADLPARNARERRIAAAIRETESLSEAAGGGTEIGGNPAQQLEAAKAAVESHRRAMEKLESVYKEETEAATAEYQEAVRKAKSSRRPEAEIVLASEAYDIRSRVARAQYDMANAKLTGGLNAALAAEAEIRRRVGR